MTSAQVISGFVLGLVCLGCVIFVVAQVVDVVVDTAYCLLLRIRKCYRKAKERANANS